MGSRDRITMALPGDVRMADIEFDSPRPNKKNRKSRRETAEYKRYFFEKRFPFIKARKLVQQLARQVAIDLLEIRAANFEENEIKFREQQQREAKQYVEKLKAAFHKAVEKEASASAK